jgi:tetratricopeptide (TPR) repeat protein
MDFLLLCFIDFALSEPIGRGQRRVAAPRVARVADPRSRVRSRSHGIGLARLAVRKWTGQASRWRHIRMQLRFAGQVPLRFAVASLLLVFSHTGLAQAQAQNFETGGSSLKGDYDAAERFRKDGNFDRAAAEYRRFLATALDELANSRAGIGDYAKASALFEEALALTPDSAALRRDYATAALHAGALERAESLARDFLNASADNSEDLAAAHRILGQVLHQMNRLQESRKELEAAVALEPSYASEYDLAVVCLDLDDEQCAVHNFDGIEASSGDRPALHMQFGLAYGNSDFAPRAVTEFKKALAENPRYPGAHYGVAAALLAGGEDEKTLEEAAAELKEELAIFPNDFLSYAALGKIEAGYHKYPEAQRDLKRAIALNPRNPDAFLYLGQMYFDTQRIPEAEADLRRAIQLTADDARNHYQIQKAHFLLGRILMQEHREQEAHAEMQIAHRLADNALLKDKRELAGLLEEKPAGEGVPDTWLDGAAPAASLAADPAATRKQRAFEGELTPAIADSYSNLGAMAATVKNYTEALNCFERAKAWAPSLDGLDYNLGRAAFMASRFSEAIPPLTRYLRTHPGDAGIRGALAMSQFMTRDYRGCVEALGRSVEAIVSIPQMQFIYAESLVKTGQVQPGKVRLEALELAHPEIAEVHRGLGEIAEDRKNLPKAVEELERANQLNANDPETHYDLGKADLMAGSTANAIQELETAVRLMPSEARFHEALARAYEQTFRMTNAENERRIAEQLKGAAAPAGDGGGSNAATSPAR